MEIEIKKTTWIGDPVFLSFGGNDPETFYHTRHNQKTPNFTYIGKMRKTLELVSAKTVL
jgi:hypothetical protein